MKIFKYSIKNKELELLKFTNDIPIPKEFSYNEEEINYDKRKITGIEKKYKHKVVYIILLKENIELIKLDNNKNIYKKDGKEVKFDVYKLNTT